MVRVNVRVQKRNVMMKAVTGDTYETALLFTETSIEDQSSTHSAAALAASSQSSFHLDDEIVHGPQLEFK